MQDCSPDTRVLSHDSNIEDPEQNNQVNSLWKYKCCENENYEVDELEMTIDDKSVSSNDSSEEDEVDKNCNNDF